MKKRLEVIPAILEKDFAEIERKVKLVRGLVEWVQIDLADGTLMDSRTFLNPAPFKNLTASFFQVVPSKEDIPQEPSLNFELHLMVRDPLRYLERFTQAGFKRFFAHVEGDYVEEFLEESQRLGVEKGLAIDGPTPVEKILPHLDKIEAVLVMAIEAGASGRPFREETVEKIKRIRDLDSEIPIAVDGAMNLENARKVISAGATRINSNSYIFGAQDIKAAIESLKTI